MSALYLRQLELGPMENLVYLLGPADSPETAVIDAAWDVPALLEVLEADGRKLTDALLTHHHFDHSNGLPDLLALAPGVRVHAHEGDRPWLKEVAGEIQWKSAGDTVDVGGLRIACVHTPGHTPGSQCFHIPGALVSGDTLFIGACGRCDLPGGDPRELWESLTRRLASVEDQTVLLPGHSYNSNARPAQSSNSAGEAGLLVVGAREGANAAPGEGLVASSLGEERKQNPYFQLKDVQDFLGQRMRPRT